MWHNACKKRFHGGVSIHDVVSYSVLLVPGYLLALLTSSRGVYVSVAFAFLLVRIFRLMRRNAWVGFFLINVISTVLAFLLRLMMGASYVEASGSAVRLVEVDQSRLQMWFAWFKSISQHPYDWLLGKGFNFVPLETLPPGQWPSNVHNLYLQILVDSGLLGVLIVSISAIAAIKFLLPILRQSSHMTAITCFGLSLFFVYSTVSAIIDWPSGCWIAFFVMSVSLGLASNHQIFASELQGVEMLDDLPGKYDLHLKFAAFLLFFGFLFLQIPLVSSRYTYLVPVLFKEGLPF